MPVVNDIGQAFLVGVAEALRVFFSFVPGLIGAIIILLIGLFVGRLVAALVTKGLRAVHFDQIADRAEIDEFLANAGVRMDAAAVVGELAKWFIYLIFFQMAASVLGFPQLTQILNQIVAFIPRVVVAIVILLVGALAANLLAGLVRGSLGTAQVGNATLLSNVARYGVLAFAVVAALSQLDIAPATVTTLGMALIGAVALGLALAFGLGARDAAGNIATGQLIKSDIQPGMQITVEGQAGTVEQVGPLYTTIRTGSSQYKVPNAELARTTVMIGSGDRQEQRRLPPAARTRPGPPPAGPPQ